MVCKESKTAATVQEEQGNRKLLINLAACIETMAAHSFSCPFVLSSQRIMEAFASGARLSHIP